MPRAAASSVVLGRIAEAEDLYYDPQRWPAWVDGFGHVVRLEGDWPHAGAELHWPSRPGGRGRVVERVTAHEERSSQTLAVEDLTLRGTQRVAFEAIEADTRVTVTLEFEIKQRTFLGPRAGFFVRRSGADSLRRSLNRFAAEREGDLAL